MKALKIKTKVKDGKIIINVPEDFGDIIEVILLENGDYDFWQDNEIENMGKILSQKRPLDNQEYDTW